MFFETLLATDYELISKKHIIEKDRVILEKHLNLISPIVDVTKPILIKKSLNNKYNKNLFQQLSIKYSNPFFVNLTKDQKDKLSEIIHKKGLKHLVLQTYTNDNEIAIKRLEKIYDALPPKLRVNTLYKQDLCYEGNPCDITNIKFIY